MEEDATVEEQTPRQLRVGERLRQAREAAGYEISQVAAETRIPQRHLVSIEEGAFGKLPSRTYAIGFSRTYARLLGLDEQEVIADVRTELAQGDPDNGPAAARFEPGDPAHVPGRGLAWFGLFAAVLFLGGIYTFYRSYFSPGAGPAPLAEETVAPDAQGTAGAQPQQASAAPAAQGPVVFTALEDDTWVKFYDAKGTRLFEAQMAKGDSFTVPADADGPQVWTGRPYALEITIGGKAVPKLAETDMIIRDVPVSAAALLARGTPAATATDAAGTAPAAGATPANGAQPRSGAPAGAD